MSEPEDSIALGMFVDSLRACSDPTKRRAADVIDRLRISLAEGKERERVMAEDVNRTSIDNREIGKERDALRSYAVKTRVALYRLYWDQVDYLRLNHLGGYDNKVLRDARDALHQWGCFNVMKGTSLCEVCGGDIGIENGFTCPEIREGQPKHPMAHLGEPYDCTRCSAEGCMTPADWPRCYTPPAKPVAAPSLQVNSPTPEGWALVPLQPTPLMLRAAHFALANHPTRNNEVRAGEVWTDMIGAAPVYGAPTSHAIDSQASKEGHQP